MMYYFPFKFYNLYSLACESRRISFKKIKGMNKDILYIGIDPGVSGGIAILNNDGSVKDVVAMPETPRDILDFLSLYKEDSRCVIEDVGHGIPGQSSKATATFTRHNGQLEMALLALDIPTEKVTPQKWIKVYQLKRKKEQDKNEWKNVLKAKAQSLFPQLGKKVTLKTCDALLIAEYARRTKF